MTTTSTTPADEIDEAARRCRSGMMVARADLDPLLARWLANTAATLRARTHPDWQDVVAADALAIARAINAGQP